MRLAGDPTATGKVRIQNVGAAGKGVGVGVGKHADRKRREKKISSQIVW